MFTERTSVGLDVHARSVAAAGIDGVTPYRLSRMTQLRIAANWTDPADQDRCVAWARDTAAALEPHSHGGYVKCEPAADGAYVPAAFGDRLARLGALKRLFGSERGAAALRPCDDVSNRSSARTGGHASSAAAVPGRCG